MVNKAVVGVVGIILITTLGVGALVGLQGGGDSPAENPNGGNGNGASDGTPADTETDATATPGGTVETPAPPDEERTSVPVREFTERAIQANLTERLNEWRRAEDVETLETNGTTPDQLREMAAAHSVAMDEYGSVSHVIDGVDVADRYRQNDNLDEVCGFTPSGKSYEAQPGVNDRIQFEWLASTVAGETYTTTNGTQFNANESAVADALFEDMLARSNSDEDLLEPGLSTVGVGVEVAPDRAVYATVHLCGA